MRFSSEYTSEIVTKALSYRHLFAEPMRERKRWNGFKHHWSDKRLPIVLEVAEASLNQLDPHTGLVLAKYNFKDIQEFVKISDYPGGFAVVYSIYRRLHLFAAQSCDEIIQTASSFSTESLGFGIKLNKDQITFQKSQENKFGKFSSDEQLTSFVEFTVQKQSHRQKDPIRRLLCLSESLLIERDPASYSVVCLRPLAQIHSLVRSESNPQLFSVEYNTGDLRTYISTDRDNLLASLLDGVRASGNSDVHVKMARTNRVHRVVPLDVSLDEDAESQMVKLIIQPPPTVQLFDAICRFNANISYSGLRYSVTQDGLFSENKEKLIIQCLQAILSLDGEASPAQLEQFFQVLRRLFASKAGFHAFTNTPGIREKLGSKVTTALLVNNEAVNHAAIDMLCALMQPMHSNYEIRQEQMNKASLLSSTKFLENLMQMMTAHVTHGTGTLVILSMLDFLSYALCVPYSETTMGDQFDALLKIVANQGRILYKLFQYSSMTIVKGAGLVMRAIIEESDEETSGKMQELALSEGALLKHFHTSVFTQSKDVRMLTNRQLSRHLITLWVTDNDSAHGLLLRIIPRGLLRYLVSKAKVPLQEEDLIFIRNNLNLAQGESEQKKGNVYVEQLQEQMAEVHKVLERQVDQLLQHWRLRQNLNLLRKEDKSLKPVVLRKRRERVKSAANWKMFYYQASRDHSKSDLIWNYKTREELRDSLENELRGFTSDRELAMSVNIAWNHAEFEVSYPSLANEISIGDYYLRILLEEDEKGDEPTPITNSYEFFNEVYHHFLLSAKTSMRCLCLQALSVIYGRYSEEIGPFADTKYIVAMLERCSDFLERDRLVQFISKLVQHKANVKHLVNSNGVAVLVDLMTLAHLHTSRAYVPTQSAAIEASAEQLKQGSKEWYYSEKDGQRTGPISFQEFKELFESGDLTEKTRCWCQGLEGWRAAQTITQIRWTVLASGTPVLNPSELAVLILKIFIKLCEYTPSRNSEGCIVRPVPKVKKILSDPPYLPHLVQLLLTFDPTIVEKTSALLFLIVQDNPLISRVYLTGAFFFILMYTGSNILPVARFLHYTHLKQSFRSDHPKSDFIQRSVLSPIVPEACIYYLENHGSEKYAEVFLGEFDNPEVIWNAEMRRQMIEKLAAHVADYSCRLPSNIRALYQYCPIPAMIYPALETELFCHMYYLSHLCDVSRFPDWPIKEPVEFMKSCLALWHEEVDKKDTNMSMEDACEVLQISLEEFKNEEINIRKNYFKLAQKYHPDKNPEGRDMFEKINRAYEFLCSKASTTSTGPNSERIQLCIKAQSIVYSRYGEELAPYKYAGYTQLIKTIRLETQDDMLFSKGAPLLAAAAELCYHTVACSALNAEQLRRENGLEALQEAFTRCVSVLSRSSSPEDLAVQVCTHVAYCYMTAGQFPGCQEKLITLPGLFSDLVRVLYFRELTALNVAAANCVCALSVGEVLQTKLFQSGVLWCVIPNLFKYDFTLDEGGVTKEETTNTQALMNRLARVSCEACACLAGFSESCPPNERVQTSTSALLTPRINKLMKSGNMDEVLKVLNSNCETPYLIWDNATRTELLEFVEHYRTNPSDVSEGMGSEFKFTAFEKELVVGEIFIRIYNEQPTFPIEDPKNFCMDLLDYLVQQAQYLHSLMSLSKQQAVNGTDTAGKTPDSSAMQTATAKQKLNHVRMALDALRNLLRSNPGLEMQCIGHFKLLFGLLRVNDPGIQTCALEVISLTAVNQECVSDMAASNVLVYMFLIMEKLATALPLVLSTLNTFMSNSKMVKDTITVGGLLYIMDVLCNNDDTEVREAAAELMGRLLADRLSGPRCRLLLIKFLPPIFLDAVRDSPLAAVSMFDGTTENPELIWNEESRETVALEVREQKQKHYRYQKDHPDVVWKLPEDFKTVYEELAGAGELVVGGVFLRLFIANPSWVLRNPREFLTELTEQTLTMMRSANPNEEKLETLSSALVALLANQPPLAEQISAQGYLPSLCDAMRSKNTAVARSAILLTHMLAKNPLCVDHLEKLDCLSGLTSAMTARPDLLLPASQAVRAIFEKDPTLLVLQAVDKQFVQFLLSLLDQPLPEVENPQAVKAEVVKALKAMSMNLEHGEKVNSILSESSVWKEFKDQKHDLFIANTPAAGYLTGGAGVAGYLTSGMMQNAPPQTVPPSN